MILGPNPWQSTVFRMSNTATGKWSEEERLELLRLMDVFPAEPNNDARYDSCLFDSLYMTHTIKMNHDLPICVG